jgi:hypothetical protein
MVLSLAVAAVVATAAWAEDAPGGRFPETLRLGGGAGGSTLDGEPVATIDLEVMLEAVSWIDVGLRLGAVHTLERSYEDEGGMSYQAENAYASTVVRPKLVLGPRVELGLPLTVGRALLQFRYEHEYRDELTWDEELLDRVTVAMYTAGADMRVGLGRRVELQAEGGYRVTSPVESSLADSDVLVGPYARLGMSYSIR